MRRVFYTPKSKENVDRQWQAEITQRAMGALTLSGGAMRGVHLAAVLGISPRGLRPALSEVLAKGLILADIRDGAGPHSRGEAWYRMNYAALPPPPEVPRLRIKAPESERV